MKDNNNVFNILKGELNSMLLRALGYEVDYNGTVRDQDTGTRISFRNKILKCSTDGSYIPLHSRDMLFDPIVNRGLCEQLFITFMHKEETDNGIYMHMYYTSPHPKNTSIMRVEVLLESDSGQKKWIQRSAYYTLPSYCYLDLVLNMYNNNKSNVEIEALIHKIEEYAKNDLQ